MFEDDEIKSNTSSFLQENNQSTISSLESSNNNTQAFDLNSDWISLKDYAEQIGVSYEAVRQQVNKKIDLLGDHVKNIGKTRFIDSEAREILSKKRTVKKVNVPKINTPTLPIEDNTKEIITENIIRPVDIENDMIDERWTINDYRLRIKQLTDRLQSIEREYDMLKTLFASMTTSEFKSWKKQQKQEWFEQYSVQTSIDI